MHPNAQLIETFYRSFAARDAAGMAACYHPEIHFTDEVFDLHGPDAAAMWSMLCEQGQDLVTDPKQLLAVVTDESLDVLVPQFSHDDISGIADLIENTINTNQRENDIDLIVNGAGIPVSPPLQDLLTRTLFAMLPLPQGNGEVKNYNFGSIFNNDMCNCIRLYKRRQIIIWY